MRNNGWKKLVIEGWAFAAVAAIAFAGGLVIGDLGSSPKTETVYGATSSSEGGEAEAKEEVGAETGSSESAGETAAATPGAQLFTGTGCGSCHTLAAAGSTGETGPNLNEFIAPDDTTEGVEAMIVEPNSELAEGYPANVMPQTYNKTLSKAKVHQLAEYIVASTRAKPNPK